MYYNTCTYFNTSSHRTQGDGGNVSEEIYSDRMSTGKLFFDKDCFACPFPSYCFCIGQVLTLDSSTCAKI